MQPFSERKGLCGICPAGCWIVAAYDAEGKICAVRPDPDSPLGGICKLGEHSPEILYAPERLNRPLRRRGSKGTYDFEPIGWDEAMGEIAARLKTIKAESGPEATAIYTGRGSFELAMCDIFQPQGVAVSSASSVLFPFGSPNSMGVGALCYVSYAMIAPHVTMGGMHIDLFSDIENAGLIVVWGANPATDCPPLDLERILKARSRGAEVIVIDPRRTQTAKLADAQWISIRPGTDGALALGLCQVLIEEELFDEAFVTQWAHGFEPFARYVQHFRPEMVESITGVAAETIRGLARQIAAAQGAAPIMYTGLEYSDSGVQAIRASLVLWALAGQLDVPGGRCFAMPANTFPVNRDGLVANPQPQKALGRDRFPVYRLYRGESHANALPDAVLKDKPYAVRSLIILGASMITAWPQPRVWRETLQALDFLVCIDVNMTADCAYADIVLPAATSFEIESYMRYGPLFRIRERMIPPVGQARNGILILAELADRLGYGHLYPQTEEAVLRHALQGSPYGLEEVRAAGGQVRVETVMMQYKKWEKGLLRPDGKPGFNTPTGRFEIAATILAEHGYEPLPVYTEPAEGPLAQPQTARHFPLVFNSGARVATDFRSQFHHIAGLNKLRPEPAVTVNSADAAQRGIQNGDRVEVISPRGAVRMRALVSDDIRPGCIDADMGGGGPLGPDAWQACNINELTDLRFDPISGFPLYKALLCEVRKAAEREARLVIDSGETAAQASKPLLSQLPSERIYLDHNATTPLDPEVRTVMERQMAALNGNPSSIYQEGRDARLAIEAARRKVAGLLGCTARRVTFTGGGSEANNQVLKCLAMVQGHRRNHLITTAIEHPSVLNTCDWLREMGFRISRLAVDAFGRVDPATLEAAIDDQTFLVSVMTANNETGTLQPIAELARISHTHGALFHSDAVQAGGKIVLDVEDMGIDFLTLSAHKFYGPKGIGILYVRKGVPLPPLIHGGHQENGLRGGTENTTGIVGCGEAAALAAERLQAGSTRIAALREQLWQGLRRIVPDLQLNGHPDHRLPNTLNVSLPGVRGESLVLALDQVGVSFSSGSACRSGSSTPSHALMAMGLSEERAHCALRFSLGIHNNASQIDRTVTLIARTLEASRNMVQFVSCR
jgi:cysteine desulfurase NifS